MTGARFLTAGLTGTGGVIKSRPEDFEVDEIAARPPAGAGRFVRALVEKRGMSVGSSRVDLQACKLEYSIVSPK